MTALSVEEPSIGPNKYNLGDNFLYTIWLEDERFPPRIGQVGSDRQMPWCACQVAGLAAT
jgi:hypothetical protein